MKLSSVLTKLLKFAYPGTSPTLPDFSDAGLFNALSSRYPCCKTATRMFKQGSIAEAMSMVLEHFRTRTKPLFFVDSSQIQHLRTDIETNYPDWKTLTLAQAHEIAQQKVNIYAWRDENTRPLQWESLSRGPGFDVLYALRPHRFAFAIPMVLAELYRENMSSILKEIIASWIMDVKSNKSSYAYISHLVAVYRVIVLTWVFTYLQAAESNDTGLQITILKIIYNDANFIASRIDRSYPNNHLLADGFALWYFGTLFPEFCHADQWKQKGEAVWFRELQRQTYDDGSSFEHSIHYHELVCEMTAAYIILMRRNNAVVPQWLLNKAEKLLWFQIHIAGPENNPLAIGDTTEDPLFPLDGSDGWGTAGLREIYRAIFNPALPSASKEHPARQRAYWLLGGELSAPPNDPGATEDYLAFPDGGYYILAQNNTLSRLVFRTAPAPGLAVCAGHMHADVFSIYLTLSGQPFIVEAGTYTYRSHGPRWDNGSPPWRRYFMSPEAHNGLSISGHDPLGASTDDFRQGPIHSRAKENLSINGQRLACVEAENYGDTVYSGHRRGVVHVRGIYWLVYDVLPLHLPHELSFLSLQLAPNALIKRLGPGITNVNIHGTSLVIVSSEKMGEPQVECGNPLAPAGWVSSRYGQLQQAPMLRFRVGQSLSPYATLLLPGSDSMEIVSIESCLIENHGLGFCIHGKNHQDYILLSYDEQLPIEAWGIEFQGALLWLHAENGTPKALRWLAGKLVRWQPASMSIQSSGLIKDIEIVAGPNAPQIIGASANDLVINWPSSGTPP